jgi:hypothetical protein
MFMTNGRPMEVDPDWLATASFQISECLHLVTIVIFSILAPFKTVADDL